MNSHVGPDFEPDFNNCIEEAMGSALDIWTAYRQGAFGRYPAPWLGYLLLLEDCPASRTPTTSSEPYFPVFPEFKDSSYITRYELFCRKMVRVRHYNAACLLLSDREAATLRPNYREVAADLSVEQMLGGLLRHTAPL